MLDALNRLLDVTIPDFNQEAGTYVIPGHGHISDESDVAEYRNMSTIIRDRIQDLVKKGMTLEQVKAARPTLDYDGRYQATAGEWTTERFIEAVYRELAGRRGSRSGYKAGSEVIEAVERHYERHHPRDPHWHVRCCWRSPVAEPALAQVDFSGEWTPADARGARASPGRRAAGRLPRACPMNDAGRLKADSWDASMLSLPEHQTMPHPSTYGFRGPSNMRIQKVIDPRRRR